MKFCIQWPTFGPYHIARLNAAARIASDHDIELVGLEVSRQDATYGFQSDDEGGLFSRVTIFGTRVLEEISPQEIRKGVVDKLETINPGAVAITSYSSPEARACLEWCRRRDRVAILMTATKADDAPRVGWREIIKSVLVKGFDAAVVGGQPQAEYVAQLGLPANRIFTGYDVVDNDFIANEVARIKAKGGINIGVDSPFFLASARMTRRKNYRALLEAYAAYRTRVDNPWPLVCLGDGPLRDEVETQISDQHIDGVLLAGFRPYKELPGYYAGAGAFVHTATNDQWGLVVNEAMAAGLPVIVSLGAGCHRDLVIDGENGYTFSPRDTTHLARLMTDISENVELRNRFGRRSREVIDAWHPDRFGRALIAALDIARTTAPKRFSLPLRAVLLTVRIMARSYTSFNTIQP